MRAIDAGPAKMPPRAAPAKLEPFAQTIPGATVSFDMKPIPAGTVEIDDPSSPGAKKQQTLAPFWMSDAETSWDAYDAFVFGMDRASDTETDPPDAWTRPSKPYILMDRGFGHTGYPAISMSFKAASEFCKWLSKKTGRAYRLPTEAEWVHACRAGTSGELGFEGGADKLGDHAWFAENSRSDMVKTTHPLKLKAANALGLYDMHGNAAEWTVGLDGRGVAKGGSFKEKADQVGVSARIADNPALNARDPQVPKSVWWLADGGFIGFRVVCDAPGAK